MVQSEADAAKQLDGMMEVCAQVADEARVYADERRRIHAILVYRYHDEAGRTVAATVVRESGQSTLSSLDAPGADADAAVAMLCRHDRLVHALRGAGYEIPDPEDPGPGKIATVFIVGRWLERGAIVVDPALVAEREALDADLDAAPASVVVACLDRVKEALTIREAVRREDAIVVCDCNDPRACEVLLTIGRELGMQVTPEPDKAATIVHRHAEVARIARALGYVFADPPEPPVGWMRVFLFFAGRVTASVMEIEPEEAVARAQAADDATGEAQARPIFEAKEFQISKAVHMLATAGLLLQQIVVVWGSRSATCLAVYRELATLPGLRGFPPELPPGIPISNVPYDPFMEILRRHGGPIRGIEAAALGVNQVRIATFTPGGVYIQRMEAIRLARGGSA